MVIQGGIINVANIETVSPVIEEKGKFLLEVEFSSGRTKIFEFDTKEDAEEEFKCINVILDRIYG